MTSLRAANHREDLKRPLLVSAGAHSVLLALLLVSFHHHYRGEPWGGPGGGAVQVSVVRSLPGIPLPRPPVVAQGRVASESPGLYRSQPKPEPPRQPERVTELPRFGETAPRERPQRARRQEPRPAPLPPGAIPSPSGEGGPAAVPYTSQFQLGAAEGGMSFGSGGSFGARYPWYVESVRRRISSNWLLSAVDPYVQWAPRAEISFDILRNGTVVNVQMTRSSGVPSVDRSAIRAIRDSSPLDRLPSAYSGERVLVEFWFDFRRQR